MAEIANKRVEETIPEFEELMKLDLFLQDNLRCIIRKHKDFEYKIRRKGKTPELFFKFIDYKLQLLKLCRLRMKSSRIEPSQRRNLQKLIRGHIIRLFKNCTKFFPDVIEVWNKYIEFLTSENFLSNALEVFDLMLAYHNEPEIYVNAANLAFSKCLSVNRARQILLKGIRSHKTDHDLYTALFKLELEHAIEKHKIALKDNDVDIGELSNQDPVLKGELGETVFLDALNSIADVNFMFSFFHIACAYKDFLPKLPLSIYRAIKDKYRLESEMWRNIAMIPLSGIDCETNLNEIILIQKKSLRVRKCMKLYGTGLKTCKCDELWIHMIDTLFFLRKTMSKSSIVKEIYNNLICTESIAKRLTASNYISWLELLDETPEEFVEVANTAIGKYPDCIDLYIKKMEFYKKTKQEHIILEIFEKAKLVFCNNRNVTDTVKLWSIVLKLLEDTEQMPMNIMLTHLQKSPESQLIRLKPLFFDCVILRGNASLIKEVFKSLENIPPYELELYTKMIAFCQNDQSFKLEEIRNYYEQACRHFGTSSSDLWLDYIKFECSNRCSNTISLLYNRAVKQLEPVQSDKFINDFSIWKTEF